MSKKEIASPLRYFGGKKRLSKSLIPLIPHHKNYVEVFCGAAWLLFLKPKSKLEVINDLDGELMNFWRVLKFHKDALLNEIVQQPYARQLFKDLNDSAILPILTDIQRSARYFFLQLTAFNSISNPDKRSFGTIIRKKESTERVINFAATRLRDVILEQADWRKLLKRYNYPDTFFFLDPPYLGHKEYSHNFEEKDFEELADTLSKIDGSFLLTHKQDDKIAHIFQNFHSASEAVRYQSGNTDGYGAHGTEMLISNYPLSRNIETSIEDLLVVGLLPGAVTQDTIPRPAKDLFPSTNFMNGRAYLEALCDNYFVVSPLYGLMEPEEVVSPHETFENRSSQEDREWAENVFRDLMTRIPKLLKNSNKKRCKIISLLSDKFKKYLIPLVKRTDLLLEEPLMGLPIGRRISWLKNANAELQKKAEKLEIKRTKQASRPRLRSIFGF